MVMSFDIISNWFLDHPRLTFLSKNWGIIFKITDDNDIYDKTMNEKYGFITNLADPEAFNKLEAAALNHMSTCSQCCIEENRWLALHTKS